MNLSHLALYLLGPPRIELKGELVHIPRRKVVALIAYLAVTGTPHSRDALATLLWPERSQSRARAYLRRALSELNRTLGEGFLTIDRETAALTPSADPSAGSGRALSLDVDVFRELLAEGETHDHTTAELCPDCVTQLEEAVELYHDDFMAGFTLRDSPEFDEWQFFEREALRDKLAGTLERLVRWHSSQGEYESAIAYARRAVALDPLHEPAQRLLIQLYDLSGQRAGARRQYSECVRILKDELGAPPSAETKALYERITAGEPEIITPPVRTVRGYELRERIGSGGFGEVYRAYQPSVARDVAVKVILPQYTDHPEFIRRFATEAQLVARLEHPHIVPLYDYWRDSEGAYLVMRWLRGGNLHQSLQRGPWSPEAALRLLDQIADALTAAHRQGVVHRDIKPENILLDQEGNAYLSDFGIAKDLAHAAAVTDPEAVPGSLWYISPEQAKSETVTPQSDVYSLGIVLYEVLMGQHPFAGSTPPDQLIKRLTEPLPPLRVRRTDLPAALELVIQRATASDLAERYPDAPDFAREFREALSRMEVVAPVPSRARIHNLPAQATPFVGREAELAEIGQLLDDPDCRLLTLVGPGGSGKTRLALAAAEARLDAHQHGVFFVSLAPLEDPNAIVSTVADALGFRFYGGEPPREQLLSYLRQKNLLLIMDNYEHLLEGVGLVSDIIQTAPAVKVLATSRARLNVGGEHRFHVGGMDYPESSKETAAGAQGYSAVKLFSQGARRAKPGFQLTDDNLSGVLQVCSLVEGMPLGIRLAAAWVQILAPAEIASEIRRSLDFLETDRRRVPERQRSMRAAFDHSWNLLSLRERELVAAFSVFRGGCTREAAQAVTDASLRELLGLANKSLLDQSDGGRFQMHELVRAYATEKLEQSLGKEHADEARDRHCEYFIAALQRWRGELKSTREQQARAEMEVEIENARVAWYWAAERRQVAWIDQALEGLCLFLWWYNRTQDGKAACRVATDALTYGKPFQVPMLDGRQPDETERLRVLARVLAWHALFVRYESRDLATQLLERSSALLEQPELADRDTRREQAFLQWTLALLAFDINPGQAIPHFERCRELYRDLRDRYWVAHTLRVQASCAMAQGRYDDAKQLCQEALTIQRALDIPGSIGFSLLGLGFIARVRGDFEEAESHIREGIATFKGMDHRDGEANGLWLLSAALGSLGKYAEACQKLEESLTLQKDLGMYGSEVEPLFVLGVTAMRWGEYDRARSAVTELLDLAKDPETQFDASFGGRSAALLGALAVVDRAYDDAQALLRESVAAYREFGLPNELADALAYSACAACGLGDIHLAKGHLGEAFQVIVENRVATSLMNSLPAVALFFSRVGEPQRAVEMYALASRYPLVFNGRWYEDVAGMQIAAAAAVLPPDVVAAAQERGRARDLWETAEELLHELSA